jgi:hypothetical protein
MTASTADYYGILGLTTAAGVEATPTVLVAGAAVRPQARPIAAAVARAASGR